MKKRNWIIITIVFLIGIAAVLIFISRSKNTTFKQDYHIEDTESIERIYLADKQDNHVLLTKQTDRSWLVDDTYPASKSMIDLCLETLNTMRIRQKVNKNAIPNVIKDISAHGIKVEVYQKTYAIDWFNHHLQLFPRVKNTVTYYVGRETQDLLATHFFREGDDVPYIIHIPSFRGMLTPRFVTDPYKWRSHTIVDLDVHQIQSVELQIPEMPNESFRITNNGNGFDLTLLSNNQQVSYFDTARVAQMLSSFTWLNFDEFAQIIPHSHADSCVSLSPRTILTITDTSGNSHSVRTYIKYTNPDDLQAIPDPTTYEVFDLNRLYAIIDNKDTVLIQYYVFDNILQPASYFLGHQKTAFAK